ncbi:hypothetical protein CP555_20950, partial [Escherichia coli]
VPAYGPQNDVTLKMPAFEWVHVQLHQQKGMISLSPPTICNSAAKTGSLRAASRIDAARAASSLMNWLSVPNCAVLAQPSTALERFAISAIRFWYSRKLLNLLFLKHKALV